MTRRIALSSATTKFTPPSLEERGISFTLREPTEGEMDRLAAELFMRRCVPVEQNSLRAHLINELYKLYDEAEADELAAAIEQVWTAESEQMQAIGLWQEQERQRLLDIKNGAPDYPGLPMPKSTIPVRLASQAQLAMDHVNENSETMRALTVRSLNYEQDQKDWTMRLYIRSWTNAPSNPVMMAPEHDETGEALTADCLDRLAIHIGPRACREIYYHINGMFNLTMEEVGNSGSPANGDDDPTPSPTPSDGSGNSGGSSTTSSTEPTPAGELGLETTPSSISG